MKHATHSRRAAVSGLLGTASAALLALSLLPSCVLAQVPSNDFVVTGAMSYETYKGNFSIVSVPTVDSTENASAAVGEFGARGNFNLFVRSNSFLEVDFDGGLRQFAATGFQLRDYAPREWVSRLGATYWRGFAGVGALTVRGQYRGRVVEDRPPMPLFLQPGYKSYRATGVFHFVPIQNVVLDAQLDVERSNYDAPRVLPWLDLLDRNSQGVEIGARTSGASDWSVRFFGGFRSNDYVRQGEEQFRQDKTVNLGALWSLDGWNGEGPIREAEVGVEGIVNRSNSLRPEYDALSVTANATVDLPWWGLSTGLASLLTWKTYVHQTPFTRLVPGEEADNASVVHLDLTRDVAVNLNATLRFGWTRAETDVGNSYYSRFGTSLLFDFRPAGQ